MRKKLLVECLKDNQRIHHERVGHLHYCRIFAAKSNAHVEGIGLTRAVALREAKKKWNEFQQFSKQNLPYHPIESATIGFSGDNSVGIRASSFDIEMFFDPTCMAIDDLPEALKEIKEKLVDAYEAITGERGHVMFDYEIRKQQ